MEVGDDPRASLSNVGVVVIGRNEGERLRRCLASLPLSARRVIYVDSGSSDGSVELALTYGAAVFPLDLAAPFTAARARNAGIDRLLEESPTLGFVFVIDGDCELREGFLRAALLVMREDDRVAVVCGRRRERSPQGSNYDRLCDMEWDTPLGTVDACGGDALLRVSAVMGAHGYDASLIAGEEPDLCYRLRQREWSVRRIDHEMTWHEAGLDSFARWWRRSVRAGHAYAELYVRHGYWAREVFSIAVYALLLPLWGTTMGAWFVATLARLSSSSSLLPVLTAPLFGLVLFVSAYLALYRRVRRDRIRRGDAPVDAALYARFCVIAKFAQLVGMAQYAQNRVLGKRSVLIEYKQATGEIDKPVAT